MAIAGGVLSWRNWNRTGREWPSSEAGVVPRSRFLAAIGVLGSVLFSAMIIAQWLAIIALGVGPVGTAFYAWDIGMKRGDIRVLGAASYATPLLSTAFLMMAGFAKPSGAIAIAAVLIAGGGLIAAKDMVWRRSARVK